MKNSVYDSSSFWGSRRSHRASECVSFAHPCTFFGSAVVCTRAASPPPPPPGRSEHVPGGGAAVVMSAAQFATLTLAAATFTAGRGDPAKVVVPVLVNLGKLRRAHHADQL
jgi:hypothetical protein